jgi:hypothetical protein
MDLRKLLDKLESIKEADLTPQQQAQNVLQPGANKDKEKEYARAQAQMDRLEKAAKYNGDDEIVRSRVGLPPKLPSIDQWDGKMPQPVGKPDWFSRLATLGKSTDDQAAAVAANKADDTSTAFKKEKLTKLNNLVSQLKNILNPSNATAGTTGAPNMGQVNKEASIFESLMREFEDEVLEEQDAPVNKEELVKQIQALMGELGDMGDDPEIADALKAAQQAVDDSAKQPEKPADGGGAAGSKPDPAKVARFKELLAKAGPAPASSAPAKPAAPVAKTESMSELMARVQRIAEGRIDEALTPEEKTELDALAKELEAFTGQDPALDALLLQHTKLAQAPAGDKPAAAGADPKVQQVQQQLKDLGVDPGPIDGKTGPKTIAGIKAFQTMAGIAADGKIGPQTEKALADGKNVVARSQLTQSLAAIEKLVAKYNVTENFDDVTEEDIDAMTMEEARSFVLKNIKVFSEAEQIAIMRDMLTEAPSMILGPDGKPLQSPTPAPAAAPAAGGNWWSRAKDAVKAGWNSAKSAGGSIKQRIAVGAAGVASALGLGTLLKSFSNNDVEMDPADLAELQKHLAVLDKFGQDPAVKGGLPADVQKRLDGVIAKLGKLKGAKAKGGAPAQPAAGAPAAPAKPAGNNVDISGTSGNAI